MTTEQREVHVHVEEDDQSPNIGLQMRGRQRPTVSTEGMIAKATVAPAKGVSAGTQKSERLQNLNELHPLTISTCEVCHISCDLE